MLSAGKGEPCPGRTVPSWSAPPLSSDCAGPASVQCSYEQGPLASKVMLTEAGRAAMESPGWAAPLFFLCLGLGDLPVRAVRWLVTMQQWASSGGGSGRWNSCSIHSIHTVAAFSPGGANGNKQSGCFSWCPRLAACEKNALRCSGTALGRKPRSPVGRLRCPHVGS